MITTGGSGLSGSSEFPKVYITQLEVDHPVNEAIYAPRFDQPGWDRVGHVAQTLGTATITMEMSAVPGAMEIIHNIMKQQGEYTFGVRRDEWKCIWCGSILPITMGTCTHCGGSRGWIM
jgi:hypothetical protein